MSTRSTRSTRDTIEREIAIDAPPARVWELISEPGWWVGDGDRSEQRRRREGDLEVVEDPKYGRYPIRVEAVEPPHYAAFLWAFAFPGEAPDEANSTRVEFWLSERDGGTLLRVVESGFANLIAARGLGASIVDGNVKGWTMQLKVTRATVEQFTV